MADVETGEKEDEEEGTGVGFKSGDCGGGARDDDVKERERAKRVRAVAAEGGRNEEGSNDGEALNPKRKPKTIPPSPGFRRFAFRPLERPVSRREMERSLSAFGLYSSVHETAFVSEEKDMADVVVGSDARKPPAVKWLRSWGTEDNEDEEDKRLDEDCGLSLFRRLKEAAGEPEGAKDDRVANLRSTGNRNVDKRFVPSVKPPRRERVAEWATENGMGSKEKRKRSLNLEPPPLQPGPLSVGPSTAGGSSCGPASGDIGQEEAGKESGTVGVVSSDPSVGFDHSAIEGPTLMGNHGFKCGQETALGDVKAVHEASHVTVMSVEVHCLTRHELNPDPEFDAVNAVFFSVKTDAPSFTVAAVEPQSSGWILVAPPDSILSLHEKTIRRQFDRGRQFRAVVVETENQLFDALEFLVRSWDPDILVGWEIEMFSWGYLMQRGVQLNRNLQCSLARVSYFMEAKLERKRRQANRATSTNDDGSERRDNNVDKGNQREDPIHLSVDWQNYHTVPGRIMLCGWRTIKYSLTLNNYSFENAVYHILHERVPRYQFSTLTAFFLSQSLELETLVFAHFMTRAMGTLRMLLQLDLISSTSEMARVFGIQFHDVLTRGSQFRVESMMFRFSKPRNYVLVSPSMEQRAHARAPVVIPLNLEPESKFYTDPVIVLDFQSLYPSIMIAYNYCYSTCLGRVEQLGGDDEFPFGATRHRVPRQVLEAIKHDVNASPCGVAFLNSSQGSGVLPKMLSSILSTRIMVKQAMKKYKHDTTLSKVLDYRQMGLKLIANVTFGYTAANYSGRMPLVELGDSIVAKSRETLERAIDVVEKTRRWDARVVYGDTDSMFVLLKGRSTKEAFKIGEEIAEVITKMNPSPVKLKLEKCYESCVLMTKKRYCGYMRETPSQDPVFEGKGIETVRRDGCAVVSKVLESALKILFRTKDVSLVKTYVQKQMTKTIDGRIPMQDLIIAKEYRGSGGYRPGACVPSLEIARKATRTDRRAEPRSGERVAYVIVNGPPGLPLIKMVRTPLEVLRDPNLAINSSYYITKQILPALQRVFSLLGVNVACWFDQVYQGTQGNRRRFGRNPPMAFEGQRALTTISQFFASSHCLVCSEKTGRDQTQICDECARDPRRVVLALQTATRDAQRKCRRLSDVCQSCSGGWNPTHDRNPLFGVGGRQICLNYDCPVVFRLGAAAAQMTRRMDAATCVLDEYG